MNFSCFNVNKNSVALFIYFGCSWSSLLHDLSLSAGRRSYSLIALCRRLTVVAALLARGLQQLQRMGPVVLDCSSVVVSHGLQLLRGSWYLPGPGTETMSPALVGRFSTTEPPGKPSSNVLKCIRRKHDWKYLVNCILILQSVFQQPFIHVHFITIWQVTLPTAFIVSLDEGHSPRNLGNLLTQVTYLET